MKILPILNSNPVRIYNAKAQEQRKTKDIASNINLSMMPMYFDLVSFKGGKSLSLEQTVAQLDKHSAFPPDIRQMAMLEIKAGNPKDKTLIDIHKDKYAALNGMETLAEVKKAFPEFKDVLSDSQIDYKPNSFVDDIKTGRNKYFDPEIDLSLQLLQLYWGEGFSRSDLTEQFDGRNIQGTMDKLNIPRVERNYGLYLKLSDKDYNARFSKEMSERSKMVARNIAERREGVYIPKGPLSESHKRNISQGLLKFYSEHPERLSEMSKRQQEFYENNPVEKTKFSQVLYRAWGYREADSIRKRLSKFMGKKELTPDELTDILPKSQERLKEFWKRNPWAAQQFSKCMKKSWEHQKDLTNMGMLHDPIFVGKLFSDEIAKEITAYAGDKMPDIEKYLTFAVLDPRDEEFIHCDFVQDYLIRNDKAVDIMNEYFDAEGDQDKHADVVSMTIDIVMNDLLRDSKKLPPKQKVVFNTLHSMWKKQIADRAKNHEEIKTSEIVDVYLAMVNTAVTNGAKDIADRFNSTIEEAYRLVKSDNVEVMSKRTKTLYEDYKSGFINIP